MQKRPMIKHSKRITDDDDVYTRRYTVPLKRGGTPSFLFGVETSVKIAFEHLWHGEVVPFFPFLTAVENGETADMLAEMGSAGVMMAVLVTAVWCGMLAVSSFMEKRAIQDCKFAKEGM